MSRAPVPPARAPAGMATSRTTVPLVAALIVVAAIAAYARTLDAPFIFDDRPGILDNASIRHLWPLGDIFAPTPGQGTSVVGRPVINLSLALNYAMSGTSPRGYHVTNLLLHALAGLALFGLVRRTLLTTPLRQRFGPSALLLATMVALLWTLHPLQTESVTCVIQRTESLMGLFFLLTFYAFIRGAESATPVRWNALAVAACLLGMASKEVMVAGPLLVFLYDRTFVAGSFAAAWRQRRALHLALASTWLLLAALMLTTANRGGTVGLGLGTGAWHYLLTQCEAVVLYLRLTLWPHGLVLDYGTDLASGLAAVWPQALLLVALLGTTTIALVRRPVAGFVGAWFFVILAPSSSFVPLTTQTIAEHRMYLPLAAVIAAAVLAAFSVFGRRSFTVFFLAAGALGLLTWQRNELYRDELALWQDNLAHRPSNPRAYSGVALALDRLGRSAEAAGYYERALPLRPDATVHLNYADLLQKLGRPADSLTHLEEALRLNPVFPEAHYNLGNALVAADRVPDAIAHYREAIRLRPDYDSPHFNLGYCLLFSEHPADAAEQFRAFIHLHPGFAPAHQQLAEALLAVGRPADAIREYETALRLQPDLAAARDGLARAHATR